MAERMAMTTQPATRLGVPQPRLDTSTSYPNLGSIDDIRGEIDDALKDAREFYIQDPDQVMQSISGHVARLIEISQQIRRIESGVRHLKAIRTDEVDQTVKDLLNLFQIHSRLLESRKLDYQITAGMGA